MKLALISFMRNWYFFLSFRFCNNRWLSVFLCNIISLVCTLCYALVRKFCSLRVVFLLRDWLGSNWRRLTEFGFVGIYLDWLDLVTIGCI